MLVLVCLSCVLLLDSRLFDSRATVVNQINFAVNLTIAWYYRRILRENSGISPGHGCAALLRTRNSEHTSSVLGSHRRLLARE